MYVLINVRQERINVASIADVVMDVNVLQKVLVQQPAGLKNLRVLNGYGIKFDINLLK